MSGRDPAALRLALAVVHVWRWAVPSSQRRDWLREWTAELKNAWPDASAEGSPSRRRQIGLVVRSLGASIDALMLRWHAARQLLTYRINPHA